MGSFITLGVGELELDWGKNSGFRDYSKLFLPIDKKLIPYYYANDEVIMQYGYSRALYRIKSRLELLGYSLINIKNLLKEYDAEYADYLEKPNISFETLLEIFSKISIKSYKNKKENEEYSLGEYVVENIFKNEVFHELRNHFDIEDTEIGSYFENFDPLITLRLLIENPDNLITNLEWRTQDVIEGGWVGEDEIYIGVEETDKFLIVTEGSSDAFIIKKSIELLYPDVLDFFTFVDMEDNYPFTGTGNLYRFCQGLTSIRLQNKTLILFDNDIEGNENFERTYRLKLPKNMKIMKLPEMNEFCDFLTIGPTGESHENINGKAVAIECFLDLTKNINFKPIIRWTNYKKESGAYQGSLELKDEYVRDFKCVKSEKDDYNFSKLRFLINEIYNKCI